MNSLSPTMYVLVVLSTAALAGMLLSIVVNGVSAAFDHLTERRLSIFRKLVPGGSLPAIGTRASYRLMALALLGESAVLFEEDYVASRMHVTVVVRWWRAPIVLLRKRGLVRAFEKTKPAHVVLSVRFVLTGSMEKWKEREASDG